MTSVPSGGVNGDGKAQRTPLVAVLLSGVFPGLGQLYNRQRLKAVIFAVAAVLTGFGPWSPLEVNIDPGDLAGGLRSLLLSTAPFLSIALWSVVDAYRVARRSGAPRTTGVSHV